MMLSLATISFLASSVIALPVFTNDSSLYVSVELNGQTFINKGIVGYGFIPSNFIESTGDTLGGIGSAIALKRGTFAKSGDNFIGTIIAQPDRGFNIDGTIDYQGRQHEIDFVLTPYYGIANLSFEDAQKTLNLTYKSTLLYWDRGINVSTTGLDALAVRASQDGDPEMPIPSLDFNHLSVDCEGLALSADGTFWMSDEYGPYIYSFTPTGQLIHTIQPPEAFLPYVNGSLNFTSSVDPDTGRAANQGFEGLTLSPDGRTLFALLQTATIQDGGSDKTTNRYTRLLAYDISTAADPALISEYIVPLPQSKKNKTRAQSEMHYAGPSTFLVLARDGSGKGSDPDDTDSSYKQADLIDISEATDIHGTEFDDPTNPVAPGGVLDGSVTPATYVPFVSYINDTQLARFGLHNGGDDPTSKTLIASKWESLALAPCEDDVFPNDYFLFTAADNDFQSTEGVFDGQSFDAGIDNDNAVLVFRVTLPSLDPASAREAIGI